MVSLAKPMEGSLTRELPSQERSRPRMAPRLDTTMFIKYVIPVVSLCLLVFAVSFVTSSQKELPAAKPVVEPARSPFPATVAAAGMVEPEFEDISIGSPVPGIVQEVFVKVDDEVQKGTPLFRLDDRQLKSELLARQAALRASQAEVLRLDKQPRKEQIPVTAAQVREAEANLDDQRDQFARIEELYKKRVASEQEYTTRRQALRMAESQLAKTKAEMELLVAGAWQYDKEVAQSAVEEAKAQIQMVETELDRLMVRALADGTVLQVKIRPGEYVGTPPSQPLIILGSVKQLHVRADIDENDIPRFVPGNPAKASVRGNPQMSFPLRFVRTEPYVVPKRSLTGQNTERVDTRVLQVIYAIDHGDEPLYVGQQLEIYVDAAKPKESAGAGEQK